MTRLTPAEATAASYCVCATLLSDGMVSAFRLEEQKHPGPCRFCPDVKDPERRAALIRAITASHLDERGWDDFKHLSGPARWARIREAATPTEWWAGVDTGSAATMALE